MEDEIITDIATGTAIAVVKKEATTRTNEAAKKETNSPNSVIGSRQKQSKIETLVFPAGLTDRKSIQNGPHVVIKAYEYQRKIRNVETNQPLYRIYLPMPPNVMQGYSTNLTNFSGSSIADITSDAFSQSSGGNLMAALAAGAGVGVASTLHATVKNAITNYFEGKGGMGMVAQNAFYSASSPEMRSQLANIGGITINPRYETAFNTMNLRQHNFTFPLVATSKRDSETINKIVRQLRYSIHPSESLGDIIYSYPDKFVVEFRDHKGNTIESLPYLPDCFVSEFSVNSMTARMHDNDPVITTINIAFSEQHVLTRKSVVVDPDNNLLSDERSDGF